MKLKNKPRILVLGFGGTIAMAPGTDGVLRPARSVDELLAQVPTISEIAAIHLDQLLNKDSTNITPTDWTFLIQGIVKAHKSNFDGILVTHGTDTMAYTASAVALALGRGLNIPVVFTGAQLPISAIGTDAKLNLENAIKTIITAREQGLAEVMITFSNKVLRAVRAMKVSESDFDAFDSPNFPHLAEITATGITFNQAAFRVVKSTKLYVSSHFERKILSLDVIPGQDPSYLHMIINSGIYRGVILRALGAGNIPSEEASSLLPAITEAHLKNIPVVVSTQFVGGNTHMEIYEPGKKALDLGAIPTGDMTDVMAQVKLMWLLGNMDKSSGKLDLSKLRHHMATSYVGEISS